MLMARMRRKIQLALAFTAEGGVKPQGPPAKGPNGLWRVAAANARRQSRSISPNRPVRTRMPGGVGGGNREVSPYPDLAHRKPSKCSDGASFLIGHGGAPHDPDTMTHRPGPPRGQPRSPE